jgi:hypothetical protein
MALFCSDASHGDTCVAKLGLPAKTITLQMDSECSDHPLCLVNTLSGKLLAG